MLLMLLVSGAEVTLAADVTADDIKINYTNPSKGTLSASVGALGSPTAGCYRVTLTATPASAYYGITTSNIIVQPLVDPASTRSNNPGIANNLTVNGSGNEFYFDLPQRYHGAIVTATFTEKSLKEISSLSEIDDPYGCYKIVGSFSWGEGRKNGVGTSRNPFKGVLDGNFVEFSLDSDPLFEIVDGAIIKNVIISSASVSTSGNAGAIANEATGASRIYNCGVNGGSVSGDGYVGSIVGLLDGSARVINCYSYADITGGSDKGGIVGYNNFASTSSDLQTMVMNCMFYGDISTGDNISPVYGGKNISNSTGGINTFNYYRYESPYSADKHITEGKYNSSIAVKEDYLVRFELYRNLLNSNKKLAAIYATGSADNADQMAKWVLETADRTITSPKPYPILKKRENGKKYPSVINYDAKNAPTTGDRNQGKKLGTLTVNISESNTTDGGLTKPTGATVTTTQLILNRTDKDYGHYNFNYDKIQLPYYNDVGTKNYTKNKVVTGWKITSITPTTGDGNATEEETFTKGDTWGGYNYADRKHYAKDLYAKNGNRIFSQGAYFDVPYGVTAITIEPYWGNAAYIADENYDVIYTDDGNKNTVYSSEEVTALGTQLANNSTKDINSDEQTVYTDIATALGTMGGSTVYDNALVLIGNKHLKEVPSNAGKAFTMMSIDLDKDNEPDYSLIYHHDNRQAVSPIRFDFLNVIGTAMAQKPQKPTAANASPKLYNVAIFKPKGWFEITNTCLIHFVQFEYDNGGKSAAPLILLGGAFDQFTSTHVATNSAWSSETQYIHVGSNVYFKNFSNGCHGEVKHFTTHIPISATGGDYDGFYLSGIYMPDAVAEADGGAECYISGGRFNEVAGAAQQQIDGDVQWQIYNADITNFYGGGLNAAQPITGDITTNIYNSNVTTFCGGPKFGDMAGVDTENDQTDDKTVTTIADGCTFTNYFGAGYGGTSYNTKSTKDGDAGLTANFGSWQTDYTGVSGIYSSTNSGIATDFEYDSFVWSTGRPAGRFYVKYASFSLAQTNDVNSILKNCTITENFYGGGNRGKVNGKATSSLEDCNVTGDVFGAGYSASDATVDVRDGGFGSKVPRINLDTGLFEEGTVSGTTTYTWVQGTVSNGNSALGTVNSQNVIYTTADLTTLGQVSEVDLIIKGNTTIGGNVFGGGAESATNGAIDVKIENGAITGNVYGGGDEGDVTGSPTITISKVNNSYPTSVTGSVFGGGNEASTTGNPNVSMTDGTVGYVYGGGLGSSAVVTGNTTIAISGGTVSNDVYGGGSQGAVTGTVSVTISGDDTHVTHDVYGGGALANTNTNVENYVVKAVAASTSVKGLYTESGGIYTEITDEDAVASDGTTYYEKVISTSVSLTGGTVRDVYGGGLGRQASEGVTAVAADVNGHVTVTVSGGKARNVFGCNNANGTPKESVEVTINNTAASTGTGDNKVYALKGVYGGGNLAHYDPTTPSVTYPKVNINGCSTSIEDVFGGGNAAAVPNTNVIVNGGDIKRVFAGGNGETGTPANVGWKTIAASPVDGDKYTGTYTGAGAAKLDINGGTIDQVFGGSNANGKVRSGSTIDIEKEDGACDMHITNVFGGGNEAAGAAGTISIGCTGAAANDEGITNVFGGANQADVTGDIELNITGGRITNVYGGNNESGSISGGITVNVEWDGSCTDNYLGNVFGGGNLAAYTGSPAVNIKNGTVSGNVYGGGNGDPTSTTQEPGSTAAPTVTIGDLTAANSSYQAIVLGDVYGGGNAAKVTGDVAPTVLVQKSNTEVGYVYGGGNAANVPATNVSITNGTIHHDVYGGGHGDKESLGEGHSNKTANVTGDVNVSVTGGTITKVFAGSNLNGSIGGTVELEIDKAATASTMRIGEVYGGGNEAAGNAGTITIGCTGTWTDTGEKNHTNANATDNRIGYELEGIGTVYGGANAADVGNNITLNITGGIVENVYGGNNSSGSIDGDITVNIEKGDATCSWYVDNVYGGGNLAAYSQKTAGHPAVNIKNGTVSGNVYGGGKGESAVVTGNPVVTIGDATATHFAIVTGDVYGGGDAAAVTGNTTVTYNDNHASSTVARLFGGGNAAGVSGRSAVTLTSGKVTGGVYGGCNSSGSVGAVTIALNGGTVGTDATHRADVYGGGLGSSTTTTDNIGITLGTDATTGTTVYGDIYGGSALGSVNASASNTSTVTLTSATLYGSVFGGGKGDNASEGEGHSDVTATSNGGATVNINVANTNLTGIYGGANVRGNVKGAIAVYINANVGASGSTLDIFGGGYGANTTTEGNVTVTIGDVAGTKTPEIYGDIYGGSALGNVNNEASDITTVNFLNGTLHGDLYGGGLGNASNAAKVNGQVIVNISNEDQLATNCHIDLRETSIFGCNNANGSPQDDVTVNIYKTDHTSDNGISGTSYAIDQVFGGGDQADYAPENGLATSTKKATVNIIGCNNTIRRVFGGGNAAAAVGVVTRIDGGHFDYVYGGGNGEVTAANIGAGGTNLQIHGGEINNLFGGSNARGTITGNMGVTVDNDCDCGQSGGTAQYVNEFFCGNNLASIGTPENPVTINAKIACGTKFGAVYGGCNLAPLYGSVNLTVEGGIMDYVYGGSKGRLADNSNPTNPIAAVAADISGDVTLTIKGGQIKNVFGGSNINGNIAGSIEVNIEKNDASTCADGWYIGNVYGASNLAAYKPTKTGNTLKVNIKNGTVSGNVYGGGKGTTATVTSNPVVTIGDVTAGHESYEAKVEDKDGDTLANSTEGLVGGNVYGGGDAAPVIGNTTVTLQGKTTVGGDVFGGGNEAPVTGTARVNIQE